MAQSAKIDMAAQSMAQSAKIDAAAQKSWKEERGLREMPHTNIVNIGRRLKSISPGHLIFGGEQDRRRF